MFHVEQYHMKFEFLSANEAGNSTGVSNNLYTATRKQTCLRRTAEACFAYEPHFRYMIAETSMRGAIDHY